MPRRIVAVLIRKKHRQVTFASETAGRALRDTSVKPPKSAHVVEPALCLRGVSPRCPAELWVSRTPMSALASSAVTSTLGQRDSAES
mmetsp:Transcript_35899/g.103173  ORF Transcript_35899/g.103173 Transcript_35899/m.103173 type:complete len:87 (+) Transcript_35899:598-858(+)